MEKEKNERLAVLLLASGTGERFSKKIPKQYYRLNQETILETTIKKFVNIDFIDHIILIVKKEHQKYLKDIKKKYTFINFIIGGKSRQQSSFIGLKYLFKLNFKYVLIHDAVRPNVSKKLIYNVYNNLLKKKAVIPVVKVRDSIKLVEKNYISKNIDRNGLYLSQTPQAFCIRELISAYKKIPLAKLKEFTDDAQIYSLLEKKIAIIKGDEHNYKVTNKKDLTMIENTYIKRGNIKIGQGVDVHKFKKGDKLFLFGKKILFNKSLEGHSDADVGIHAIIDALCGALSLGDIGKLFPDNDSKYKDIDSKILLKHVAKIILKKNARLKHLDNTVICEKPKINKYAFQMRKILSKILEIDIKSISIKATTTEKLGFLGNEEGIAVMSIATIETFSN